jgi:CubicO group peptidase (beta-lactamase class C family)
LAIDFHPSRQRILRGQTRGWLLRNSTLFKLEILVQSACNRPVTAVRAGRQQDQSGDPMTAPVVAQAAAKSSPAPQTPPLPHARPETLGLAPARLQKMSDALKREIDKGTTPGVTMLVARRGQIGWFEALGKQDPASPAPMAQDSLFRIFSMTKPIVSIGIMQLVEDGLLLLDDPLPKFIP